VGIETLNKITKYHPNVLALGGIVSEKEVEMIKNSKAKGFASIRYFFT
jgi:thiamine-phosphate pyrophosphorylase